MVRSLPRSIRKLREQRFLDGYTSRDLHYLPCGVCLLPDLKSSPISTRNLYPNMKPMVKFTAFGGSPWWKKKHYRCSDFTDIALCFGRSVIATRDILFHNVRKFLDRDSCVVCCRTFLRKTVLRVEEVHGGERRTCAADAPVQS